MTQEEKAKAYDEALERMKSWVRGEHPEYFTEAQKAAEYIFPELKESEDERIRKEIIDHISNIKSTTISDLREKQFDSWIAWLEKQGDKDKLIQELGEYKVKYIQEVLEKHLKTINKDDERLRKTTIAFLKDFADKGYENAVECIDWLEKQGKQKLIVPKFMVGDTVRAKTMNDFVFTIKNITDKQYIDTNGGKFDIEGQDYLELVEQKPDDKVEPKFKVGDIIYKPSNSSCPVHSSIDGTLCTVIDVLDEHYILDTNEGKIQESFAWQDYYKLVRQKPAWSEEDEIMIKLLDSIIRYIVEIVDKDALERFGTDREELFSWLKSLRGRYTISNR